MRRALLLFFLFSSSVYSVAETITVTGSITQSTQDGTGPAANNPSLNNIADAQLYTLSLSTAMAITAPGSYNLTGSSLAFSVPTAPASETNFGTISLTILANGAFADYSLFACYLGADCFSGNSLSASFRIPLGSIAASNVAATGLDQPHPLDLLEDDGTTDIQGSITRYSNTATATAVTPEPSSWSLAVLSSLAIGAVFFLRSSTLHDSRRSL